MLPTNGRSPTRKHSGLTSPAISNGMRRGPQYTRASTLSFVGLKTQRSTSLPTRSTAMHGDRGQTKLPTLPLAKTVASGSLPIVSCSGWSTVSQTSCGIGVGLGDRVVVYLPLSLEGIIAMLACARIGAIHSVVYAGLGSGALRDRVLDADARLVITSDVGYRRGKPVQLKAIVDDALRELEVASASHRLAQGATRRCAE